MHSFAWPNRLCVAEPARERPGIVDSHPMPSPPAAASTSGSRDLWRRPADIRQKTAVNLRSLFRKAANRRAVLCTLGKLRQYGAGRIFYPTRRVSRKDSETGSFCQSNLYVGRSGQLFCVLSQKTCSECIVIEQPRRIPPQNSQGRVHRLDGGQSAIGILKNF